MNEKKDNLAKAIEEGVKNKTQTVASISRALETELNTGALNNDQYNELIEYASNTMKAKGYDDSYIKLLKPRT